MKLRCIVLGATIVALLALAAEPVSGQDEAAEQADNNDHNNPSDGGGAQMQPASEEPVKFVHVLNPGEREYLSPNLIGVQNIAMTYLPLTMNFVNIIDAFREIVNGVRYEILLNAVDTKANDADIVCRLVVLEKPWLRTEWGDKVRELQHSNCTSEVDNLTDPEARNKYESNRLFSGASRNELSTDEMDRLLTQIMDAGSKANDVANRKTPQPGDSDASDTSGAEADAEVEGNTTPGSAANTEGADESAGSVTEPTELSDNEKKWLDDFLSVGALNFENSLRKKHSDENDSNNNDEQSEVVADGQSNYLQQTQFNGQQEEQQQLQEPEDADQQQAVQEPEVETEQFQADHVRAKRSYGVMTGGISPLDNSEAESRLQKSLDKLAAGDGPNYKIHKINSATTQVVSGYTTRIDAELIDDDNNKVNCQVEIWTRAWLKVDGTEVTFDCDGKDVVKKRHSRSVEYAEKKSHKKHAHQGYEKVEHLFNKFQMKYGKRYHNTMERQMRLRIFRQNLKTIEELNRNEMGSAKYGITEFADMTSTEYKQRTGLWQREEGKPSAHPIAEIPDIELPKEFDWREKGVISEVKNQGNCGSCWAFSVTGNIEGLHAVKTGQLEEYSEQELLDCDTIDSACNGGLPDNAYKALEKIGGLELESEYPYEGRKQQCHFNNSMAHVRVKGAVDLPKNETAMAQWLMANGPISIGINANAMQFYRGGVSHPWRPLCAHSNLDHGVLIVGFGVSDYPMFKKTLPYWIVKNSWGKKWGEQGYYRVYRGDNTCGVSEMATSAVLE